MGLVKKTVSRQAPAQAETLDKEGVRKLLASKDPADRRKAAKVAGEVQGGPALLVEAMGREKEPSVLERISLTLGDALDDEVVTGLLEHLRAENAALRNAVIDLVSIEPVWLEDKLVDLMRDPEVDFRIMLVQVASGMQSPRAVKALCDALPNEQDDNVCGSILEAITAFGEGPEVLAAAETAADRFADHPFLSFAAQLARDRVAASVKGA